MSEDVFDLKGRVVIVTGGAGLLGSRYVRALSAAGAGVIVADLDEGASKRVAESCDGDAVPVRVDVTDPDSINAMVEQTMDRFGRIDGLVNNAAIDPKFEPGHAGKHTFEFETYPLKLWNQALDVNLTGMFLCTQAVVGPMVDRKQGAIVNISSTYGLVAPDQRLYEREGADAPRTYKPVTYSVTKSAVFGFTRYLATYYGGTGIRANTLSLGGVFNDHDDEFVRRYSSKTPLGRMAHKDEYCGALIFLLSDASSYMTGANLVVDGGWTAW